MRQARSDPGFDAGLAFLPGRAERFTAAHYALGDVDIEALVSDALLRPPEVWTPSSDRSTLTDLNSDLFPKDEYLVSFALWPPDRRARVLQIPAIS